MNIFSRWKDGLAKTSKSAFGQIATLLGASEITNETWDDLEALLIQADVGIETTTSILDSLKRLTRDLGLIHASDLYINLKQELRSRLIFPPEFNFNNKPTVILIVGVNGAGKTTTIAKLTSRFTNEGKQVLLGAADTFRAAAVDQLEVWANRLQVEIISGAQDSDPGAVAFNTIQSGISRKADIILIDTAGRLHTRFNLMEELKKSLSRSWQSTRWCPSRSLARARFNNWAKRLTTSPRLQRCRERNRRDIIKTRFISTRWHGICNSKRTRLTDFICRLRRKTRRPNFI
ncbi:MAG: cell division protein FtsY [Chloroflexi bacterium OLB14]|nr:MAG: cell division protein FtsY [Chloroflexi bacterium OLB14]